MLCFCEWDNWLTKQNTTWASNKSTAIHFFLSFFQHFQTTHYFCFPWLHGFIKRIWIWISMRLQENHLHKIISIYISECKYVNYTPFWCTYRTFEFIASNWIHLHSFSLTMITLMRFSHRKTLAFCVNLPFPAIKRIQI